MIDHSNAYTEAIVGDTRRILLRAIIDIIDPEIVYGTASASGEMTYSKIEQIYDKVFDLDRYATLEINRWTLDGNFSTIPDDGATGQIGLVLSDICDENGFFSVPQYAELRFSNVSILQACSVHFSKDGNDGIPVDFKIEVLQDGTSYHTEEFTGNESTEIYLTGFTVYNPDAIRVTITKWSLPGRRVRIVEIIPGTYEILTGDQIGSFSLKHQGDISCVSLPYGTCTLGVDNLDRRFEPRNKQGIFKSIEERQGIDVALGVRLADGTEEYKRVGVFYQSSGGWKTGDNGLTIQWDMVDIVGLLVDREFIQPEILPTTLSGWIASLVVQLGNNLETHYTVDPNYAETQVTVLDPSDVAGLTCGDILLDVCMATGTWPRADAETGYLAVEPLWNQGSKITLDNLKRYPTMKANSDIAAIVFTLNDENGTQYVVSGNDSASSNTISVKNPFIKTEEQALTASKMILSTYGGNRIEIVGRGDMASEIGDVDTIWLNESVATTARRIQQDLSFSGGVLKDCASVLLQADGSFLFQNREVITESGTWTAPAGITSLRVILVGKGSDGEDGGDGTWDESGEDGASGAGGKVWAGTISINEQQAFDISIGDDTVFGVYTSADGSVYPYGYTDIASGDSFARTGVSAPLTGSGDGGAGGAGGSQGRTREKTSNRPGGPEPTKIFVDQYPKPGKPGVRGATGCVVIYWDKE